MTETVILNFPFCSYFNSHAHVERDFLGQKTTVKETNFNSHAHVERDFTQLLSSIMRDNFNSHAHVERDSNKNGKSRFKKISTHTLTWSVTIFGLLIYGDTMISTHTLTWSVTLDVVYIWCLLNVMRTYFFI